MPSNDVIEPLRSKCKRKKVDVSVHRVGELRMRVKPPFVNLIFNKEDNIVEDLVWDVLRLNHSDIRRILLEKKYDASNT